MEPKEKAKEIFDEMYLVEDSIGDYPMCFDTAKQCALIAVDLRLDGDFIFTSIEYEEDSLEYWQEVKEELLKITFYGTTRNC